MGIEEMNIEELQQAKIELLVEYYNIDARKAEISETIGNIDNRINLLSSQNQETMEEPVEEMGDETIAPPAADPIEEVVIDEPVQEITEEVVQEEPVQEVTEEVIAEEPVQEEVVEVPVAPATEEVAVAEEAVAEEPVQEATEEVVIPAVVEDAPVEETAEEEVVSEGPVLPPVVEEPVEEKTEIQIPEAPVEEASAPVTEDVVNPQALSQEPLVPAGMELPAKKVFVKMDSKETTPRAILTSSSQNEKLRKSKEQNEALVFAKEEVAELNSETTVATSEESADLSKEDINKQLEAMYEELRTTTDEVKANEINNEISVLTKKLGEAA